METISSKTQKARKEHQCDWCNGTIKVGETYRRQFLVYDEPYTWKNHIPCEEIASKLNWFDNCCEGLTSEDFWEFAKNEYMNIMSEFHNEIYESNDFKYPSFLEQLEFIKKHHKID